MKRYLVAVLIPVLLLVITGIYFFSTVGSSYASDIFTGIGENAQDNDRLGSASFFYKAALKFNSKDSQARIGLAGILEKKGDKDAAETLLQEGIDLVPSKSSLYLELAALYTRSFRFEAGVRLLDQVTDAYAGLGIRNKRPPNAQAQPSASLVNLPASFTLTEQAGVTYYYLLTVDSSTSAWMQYKEPVVLNPGRQSFQVVGVSEDGIPSRIVQFSYVCEEASSPAFSALFTEQQLEAIKQYVEEKIKEALNEYTFVPKQK